MDDRSERSALEVVKELYDAFDRADMVRIEAIIDEDVRWFEAEGGPYGGQYHDRDTVIEEVFVPLEEEWDEFVVDRERFVDGGDTILVTGTYRGTYGETGRSFESPFAHVWDVENGQIARFHQHVDTVLHMEPVER